MNDNELEREKEEIIKGLKLVAIGCFATVIAVCSILVATVWGIAAALKYLLA